MADHNTFHSKLGDDGRAIIPAPIRKRFGLQPGDTLVWDDDGGKMKVTSYQQVLRDVQESFAPYRIPGVSAVDELIAERRAEAAKEEAESQTVLTEKKGE